MEMKGILLSACMIFVLAGNLYAADILIPAGTRIEGTTMFGTFAPADTANAPNFFLTIRASGNPVGAGGDEIPLKDCVILGDVVADITVNRAFFRAIRIVCSNAKEPNGTLIKGYAIDYKDNKLGILGIQGGEGKSPTPPRFVEVPSDAKVYLFTVEAASITIK